MEEELKNTIDPTPSNTEPVIDDAIYNETTIPDKFINPHTAEGIGVHQLKAGNFEMPISFQIENGRFAITGIENTTQKGGIISGRISGNEVKINHIDVNEKLRGTGISKALLADLEKQLTDQGLRTIYAAFFKSSTVEFLLRNGYTIIPASSLTEETRRNLLINTKNLDSRINSQEQFTTGKDREDPRQILLAKQIGVDIEAEKEIEKETDEKTQTRIDEVRKSLELE